MFDPERYIHPCSDIVIRKNSTGETRTIKVDLAWYDHSHYFWTDGNFGCDCNRHLVWLGMPKGSAHDEHDFKCGYKEYTVIKAIFPDGTEELIDEVPDVQS